MSTTSGRSRRTASGCAAVARLADDLEVLLRLEDHPEPGADECLVVDDEDAHAARRGSVLVGLVA
jgi:hypothetical protein